MPYTQAIAHDAGWQWRIPLQHRMGAGIVYSSGYLSRDAAYDRLMSSVGTPRIEPFDIKFRGGVRRKQWYRNCVAVGLAGGFVEPLEATTVHLIQRAVLRFIRMMPGGRAVVLRRGPGVHLALSEGRRFVVSTHDPEALAGLVNTLVDRSVR